MMGLLMRAATFGLYGGRKRHGAREFRRTCSRCGHVWYVTPEEAKKRAPNGMQMSGLKMQSAGNRAKLIGGKKKAMIAEQRLQRAQAQIDRVTEINRCGQCGSVTFTEEAAT